VPRFRSNGQLLYSPVTRAVSFWLFGTRVPVLLLLFLPTTSTLSYAQTRDLAHAISRVAGQAVPSLTQLYSLGRTLVPLIAQRSLLSRGMSWFSKGGKGKGKSRSATSGDGGLSAAGLRGVRKSDLLLAPQNMHRVPSSIPRNFARQIVWDVTKTDTILTTSTAGNVETNFTAAFSNHTQVTQWAALFDQYCIVQLAVSFLSTEPPGSLNQLPVLYTAIDFDNGNNLSTIAAIEAFESCTVDVLGPAKTVTRICRPCYAGNAGSVNAATIERGWIDTASGFQAISHFGIRSLMAATATGSSAVRATVTIWFAFRSGT